MNSKLAIAALIVAAGAAAGSAFAQGDGDVGAQQKAQRQFQRQQEWSGNVPPGYYAQQRREQRGSGPDQRWHRGDTLPYEYRHRNYVVNDWRNHRLSAPPRGYQWVQSGGDYLLVAIATGIIAQILLTN
ncbi:MAG: RcnB family protein [Burkholderiales bacterium]|nr:RcnB family protein [Burkholderiales bacterium]